MYLHDSHRMLSEDFSTILLCSVCGISGCFFIRCERWVIILWAVCVGLVYCGNGLVCRFESQTCLLMDWTSAIDGSVSNISLKVPSADNMERI